MAEMTGDSTDGITRRRMIGILIAAPTVVAAAQWRIAPATGQVPTVQVFDHYDLSDLVRDSQRATKDMITVTVNRDGTVSFDLPRAEVGQGVTTSIGMIIADEMDLPMEKVHVTLADARPELQWNQLTGGSTTIFTMYEPVRTAAASAREQMVRVAAEELGVSEFELVTRKGMVIAPDGRRLSYGSLAEKGAVDTPQIIKPRLKRRADQKLVGRDQRRTDARLAVTGKKLFAMDLDVPNALPAMVCRPPTINGSVLSVQNLAEVKGMPGITDVVVIGHDQYVAGGVAVRARTFGQCIDAIRALKVTWAAGTVEGKSDASVLEELKANELAMTPAPPGEAIEEVFTFHFRPGDPLEPNCAVADVRADRAEVWSCLKMPIWTKQQLATNLGLPVDSVTVHVTEGGGSFGRHLFSDAAYEAAAISKAVGKPVRLMWHRTDNFRQGRVHPMCTSRVRVVRSGEDVLAFDQRHTSVATDWGHGFGEMLTAGGANPPRFNLGYSQTIFNLTANVPYNFGAVTQELNEIYEHTAFNTSAVRNVYSPEVATPTELMVDQVAKAMGKDALDFRIEYAKDDRMRGVLEKLRTSGGWGRKLPAGVAQGLACRNEYKGRAACLVELDTRPEQVDRKVPHAYTGPRVTRVAFAVDVGLPINPLGLRAQMMGGTLDGIAQVLSYSLHLKDGSFLEGSWDDAYYMRQWNVPPDIEIFVLPATTDEPGGAGELAVGTAMAATACAVARATGKVPTSFPLNHDTITFTPFPTVPPIPQSPTNGKSPH
jgi:isoquinoline 1-oxidoreductase beta subunit